MCSQRWRNTRASGRMQLPLIDWAFSRGYRIAIATDPLFPRKATYHRLRWAGFDPERFELISSFEHFHFTKHILLIMPKCWGGWAGLRDRS